MAEVPAVPEFRDGIAATSQFNQVSEVLNFLLTPPIAELRQSSAQSLTSAVSTAIQFNAETVDTDIDGEGGHDNVTNNTRFTARYPGWYEVAGGVAFANNGTGVRLCFFAVNGTALTGSIVELFNAGAGVVTAVPSRVKQVYLEVGDYVEILGYQNSGGALNTDVSGTNQSHMTVRWVSN